MIRRMASSSSPKDRQRKRIKDLDEKWKMLFNEKPRPPLYSVDKYIEYLRKFTSSPLEDSICSEGSVRSCNSNLSSDQQISYLLKKLKIDLNMAYERFLETFISGPNYGLNLLLTLLKNIQKTLRGNTRGTAKEKMQFKKRRISEELECILCIKFCLRYKESVNLLLEIPYGLENVAEALLSSNFRSRCTALEVMSKALMEDKGFHRNLECFTYFRLKNCEPVRFKFLINMLMSSGLSNVQVSFQVHCMKFLNSLLTSSPDGNSRISLQSEIEMAGLDVKSLLKGVDQTLSEDKDTLRNEIIEYKNSLLDVDQLLESHETLYKLNMELQQKVFILQEQLQAARGLQNGHTSSSTDNTWLPEQDNLIAELDQLLDSFEDEKKMTEHPELSDYVDNADTVQIRRRGSNRNWKKAGHSLPVLKKRTKENIMPLSYKYLDPDQNMNDSRVKNPEGFTNHNQNINNDLPRQAKITFIEQNRADEFLSVHREIGLPIEIIIECIQNYDTEDLCVKNVSSLLNLLPTESEMRHILTLECELESLGDAEQFLVQLMAVDRLGEKLKLMIFIFSFNSTVDFEIDNICHLQNSLVSLMSCDRFKRFVEVANCFMIDNFYTTPLDCKLSSLFKFEVTNISETPLRDIATFTQRYHPDVLHWYTDICRVVRDKGSMKELSAYIEDSKKGINSIESEISKSSSEDLIKMHQSMCKKFEVLQRRFQDLHSQIDEICETFQESKENTDPQELLKGIINISQWYKNIVEDLPPIQNNSEPEPDYGGTSKSNSINGNNVTDSNRSSYEHTVSTELDTSVLYASDRIKDWIVMTLSSCIDNTDIMRNTLNDDIYPVKRKDNILNTTQGSDSEDSAFEGSGGSCLKKFVSAESPGVHHRSSTPLHIFNSNEPAPDYSRSNSPEYQAAENDDVGSEVSRILRDFEGDLNGYETQIDVPIDRRFYTIHSIIHL